MLRSRHIFTTAAIGFIVAISASLIACSDAASEETPFSPETSEVNPVEADSVKIQPVKTDSATTDSAKIDSVETDSAEVDQSMFETACTAENEGMIDSIENHYGKFGYDRYPDYFRCEKGSWVKRESWIRCDKGAQEDDACIYSYTDGSLMTFNEIYAYTNNGGWERYSGDHDLGKFTIQTENGRDTAFFKFAGWGGWREVKDYQYNCFSKFDAKDTCVLETNEGKNYYLTQIDADPSHFPVWIRIDYDPELGFCSFYEEQKYGEKDGKRYYCSQGLKPYLSWPELKWTETELIPQQDNDSRRNGLTDEEYDILDLPKEASTGDLVGGLLEVCFYNQKKGAFAGPDSRYTTFILNFCIPQNYYRYENGSWTLDVHYHQNEKGVWILQTDKEIAEAKENNRCTQEKEGTEIFTLPRVEVTSYRALAEPGTIYQCVSEGEIFKEFTYGRYEVVEVFK